MAASSCNVTLLEKSLVELHQHTTLWNKLKLYHLDLMSFNQNSDSQKRLESEPMAFCFMSSIYFTESELAYLLNFPTVSGLSCKRFLEDLIRTKIGTDGRNGTFCTSHDLAPAISNLYGIKKDYSNEKQFKKFCKEFAKA